MVSQVNLPGKKDVARALFLKGSVLMHLDPRLDNVVVPSWLRQQPQLVLTVGLDMAIPIPDLRVDDDGVYGTLSFNRSPFTCKVPWEAVFALVGDDGRGMVWPQSMPEEIAQEVEREARRGGWRQMMAHMQGGAEDETATDDMSPRPSVIPPLLKLVSSEPTFLEEEDARVTPRVNPRRQPRKRKLPPYLRLVK